MHRTITRTIATGLAFAGLTFGAAACSDDDGDTDDIDNPVDGVDDQIDSGTDELEENIDDGADELEEEVDDATNDG